MKSHQPVTKSVSAGIIAVRLSLIGEKKRAALTVALPGRVMSATNKGKKPLSAGGGGIPQCTVTRIPVFSAYLIQAVGLSLVLSFQIWK
jgi:hypothetical protein